jgi:hypothetical protein
MLPLLFSLILGADSHGQMVIPPSRNGGRLETGTDLSASHWYVSGVQIPGDATLPSEFITIDNERANTWCKKNPWRAPGTTAVLSPCGTGCENGKGDPFDNILDPQCADPAVWEDGRDLPKTKRVVWQQGGIAEVAWAPSIGHGGGYAYRLCPASQDRPDEACFQQLEHHLEFVDDFHTIHYTASGEEEIIPAKRTKIGTFPAGSHWSMNPIPTAQGPAAFPDPCTRHPCPGYPGPAGFSSSFSIKDRVKVPANLTPGNYTLSWRYDCEVSPQVWTNCADISITGAGPTHSEPGRLKFQPLLRHGRL